MDLDTQLAPETAMRAAVLCRPAARRLARGNV